MSDSNTTVDDIPTEGFYAIVTDVPGVHRLSKKGDLVGRCTEGNVEYMLYLFDKKEEAQLISEEIRALGGNQTIMYYGSSAMEWRDFTDDKFLYIESRGPAPSAERCLKAINTMRVLKGETELSCNFNELEIKSTAGFQQLKAAAGVAEVRSENIKDQIEKMEAIAINLNNQIQELKRSLGYID
ncbi:hypothetical protein [Vibrio phage BONAISHI]|nr:hypothetical protein [Vibrio phage BONAISHI]